MRVLVAMSGGVDSSLAAALMVGAGHEVEGVTLKLSESGLDGSCCSVADMIDARRVADELGIVHRVLNLQSEFEAAVIEPYLASHRQGRTPNPCVACNRTVKFGRLATLARVMGFDVLATGHHARLVGGALRRGADERKDQSYVLATTAKAVLEECLFPVGTMTKSEVRALAQELELRTAGKLESQDACFAASGESRAAFLGSRIGLTPATVVDARSGQVVGSVPAAELLTIGQRRGLSLGGGQPRRYVTSIRPDLRRVELGTETDLLTDEVPLAGLQSRGPALAGLPVLVQFSAHGPARPGTLEDEMVMMERPVRRPAPGQLAVFYSPGDWLDQAVVGSAEVA